MRISSAMVAEIVAHAREEAPNECCGMIGGSAGSAVSIYRAANAEASPLRYSLEPGDQYRIMMEIEGRGEELAAIYHSHTKSAAYPSQTDVNLAFYPDALYVIVSIADPDAPDVRAFRIVDGKASEAELEIA